MARGLRIGWSAQVNYSTTFPLTESVISEGGNWKTTNSGGVTFSHPVSTSGGNAYGVDSEGFNDSVACLVGPYLRDQTVTITAGRGGGSSGSAEIEIHLRCTIDNVTPQVITYEIDLLPSVNGVVLVEWHGDQGNFDNLAQNANLGGIVDGDVFTASAIGPANNTVFTVKKNGSTILSFTHTAAHTTGTPGFGFDAGSPANAAELFCRDFSAVTQ